MPSSSSRDGAAQVFSASDRVDLTQCASADSVPQGLTPNEAAARLARFGPNKVVRDGHRSIGQELWAHLANPLNGLLLVLAAISWLISDARSAIVIALMVGLSAGLGFVQEHRSSRAAAKLAAMVRVHARVKRLDAPGADADGFVDVPLEEVVPGDLVRLAAGDLVPADLTLLSATNLYLNQAALTGESMPAEKAAAHSVQGSGERLADPCLCFMGSSVTSGYGEGVAVATGSATQFGRLSETIAGADPKTSFDKGLDGFVWMMVRFILVMAPAVFLINGLTKHDWLQALFFAVAVAVGLTPEMLPMIVTVNLARGAIAMSKKRVIVKRLAAIQNFGAMDVLCTDKTGTLTQDKVALKLHVGVDGRADDSVFAEAYLNARFQSGLRNLMDEAILDHAASEGEPISAAAFRKLGEIPFDFTRRRLSVIVERAGEPPLLVCKGAVEEVLATCTRYRQGPEVGPLDTSHQPQIARITARLNRSGFRVIAVACKNLEILKPSYGPEDEAGLTLLGFIGFLDPPKETAERAIAELAVAGVAIKVLTGDNELVTRKICKDVGLKISQLVLGTELAAMSDEALAEVAEAAQVFAKVSPDQKARVIAALQRRGHVIGYLGDGINDGPALKAADVGISVDSAVDIAKETAAIIVLEKSLSVLKDGVLEGRRVFGNIIKYIRMGASSNFGNMFSVLGGSLLVPFLPMAPLQVLTNNLLYDVSQTAIPTDNVDLDYLASPRRWEIGGITRFMLLIGPISSIFDYATFFTMLYVFNAAHNPALFQTGWFVESLLTQTLIIHVIRTARIPFLQSRASAPLIGASLAVCALGVALPFSALAATLGFTKLPPLYWAFIAAFLAAYVALTTVAKSWFFRRWGV
jgi:Mg2+-importing ATPase